MKTLSILIPCFNEEEPIERVIGDLAGHFPSAKYIFIDNNSTDNTSEVVSRTASLYNLNFIIDRFPTQGKAEAVVYGLQYADTELTLMLDGDFTYRAKDAHNLVKFFEDMKLDMAVGSRFLNEDYSKTKAKLFHSLGNKILSFISSRLFRQPITDLTSGLRVFKNDILRKLSLSSRGFQLETEMTISLIHCGFLYGEIPISYHDRLEGSYSKLRTFNDGFKVSTLLFRLVRIYKPLLFFTAFSLFTLALGFIIGSSVVTQYLNSGEVLFVPRAILAASICIISIILLITGAILDAISNLSRSLLRR